MKKLVVRIVAFTTIGLAALSAIDASALALTGVKSRKVHGAAGQFDLTVDTTQTMGTSVTVEPRVIGLGHVIVFQFDTVITIPGTASAIDPFGSIGTVSAPVITGAGNNEVSVTLTGIPDNKRVTVSLNQVNGLLGGLGDFAVSMGFLVGDVDSTRVINPTDISRIKARSGLSANATSFVYDLNATGAINSSDISAAKARSGITLVSTSEVSLFVAKPSTGLGTVTSTPAGINCGGVCAVNFPRNTSVTVTAAPSTGSTFTNWTGACTGTTSTSVLTLAANAICNANFTINTYVVTPSAGTNGSISPSTVQTVNHGSTAIFTVTPNSDFAANVGGTCNGILVGTTYTTSPVTAPCTVIATFTPIYPWPVWSPSIPVVPPSTTGKTYYVDGTNGINTNNGTSAGTAYKTIAKALSILAAGDTVLIRQGLYREGIDLNASGAPSGTALKPITFGSYGDGEVILDGSTKVTGWTLVSGTVWQATKPFSGGVNPIGVVVNDVPLKQVRQGQNGSTAPQDGLAGVTSGSGKWHNGATVITADMGVGVDPNTADIVVPNDVGNQQHIFFFKQSYITFKGLTVRGSGSNGIWGYGSNITVESCNIKFNGKSAVSFIYDSSSGVQTTDNAVITSHIYHNVLSNWPRGNNGYAESGGGWPATVNWSGQLRAVARGNIVHMNGGEGIASYGSFIGKQSGSALFEQNVVYDNWSVNMYFDNQPNNVARNNFLFNHPADYNPATTNFLYVSNTLFPYDRIGRFSVCLMFADEQNSSDGVNNYANVDATKLYNNVIAGCRIGIRDYAEGSITLQYHGIKNTLIANNTIIMPSSPFPNALTFGIFLQDNANRNVNSMIANNIIYGFNNDALIYAELTGPLTGIALNNNLYFSTGATPFGSGSGNTPSTPSVRYNFSGWKLNAASSDTSSVFADPQLLDAIHFNGTGNTPYFFGNAAIGGSSPGINLGISQLFSPPVNFRLNNRSQWNAGAF